jgi:hypothetical protein
MGGGVLLASSGKFAHHPKINRKYRYHDIMTAERAENGHMPKKSLCRCGRETGSITCRGNEIIHEKVQISKNSL